MPDQVRHPHTLLVASTGGHLEELVRLRARLQPAAEHVTWLTFDDAQSRSLLAGERVRFVPRVPPRGYREAASAIGRAFWVLRDGQFSRVVSTGAGIAVPFMLAARVLGIPCDYIESAARADGPSLTGAVVARLPGVRLHCQYRTWASGRWRHGGSLFDDYRPRSAPSPVPADPGAAKVVVALGTTEFAFTRAVDRLVQVLPRVVGHDAHVTWQVGNTDVSHLPIEAERFMPARRLQEAIAQADLVISHAGVGSALGALDAGKCPVLLPRLGSEREHVDDHQVMIAADLERRGLAVACNPDELTAEDLRRAMRVEVVRSPLRPVFVLEETDQVNVGGRRTA